MTNGFDPLEEITENWYPDQIITTEQIDWLVDEVYRLRAEVLGLRDPRANHPAGKGLIDASFVNTEYFGLVE